MASGVAMLLAAAGGAAVAAAYFAGLWWTVRQLPRARHAGLLVTVSFFVRTPLAALALFGVSGGDAWRLLAAVAGFLAARTVIVRSARAPAGGTGTGALQERT